MSNSSFLKSKYKIITLLIWLFLTSGGVYFYTGSSWLYILFSVMFLILLIDGLFVGDSIGYMFFAIFMWLGFWAKLTLHLWLKYPYLEPTGYFDGHPQAWDQVLIVSIVGAMGVLVGRFLVTRYLKVTSINQAIKVSYAPIWYQKYRIYFWFVTCLTLILLPTINLIYGIAQNGILPKLILPWPLNGLIAWTLNFGLVLIIYTLIFWDDSLKIGRKVGVFSVFTEACLAGISILSRAVYLFHSIPYIFVLFKKNQQKKVKLLISLAWMSFFVLSLTTVMILRYSDISPIDASSDRPMKTKDSQSTEPESLQKISVKVAGLVVDRWIGVEGVMATVAYPHKCFGLFKEALLEERVKGKLDIYTYQIAQTKLSENDIKKYQYATIPGGIAFFYYTGSIMLVFLGMAVLTSLIYITQEIVSRLLKNPYILVFWGAGIAQTIASFGLGLRQATIYFLVCIFAILIISIIQSISPSFDRK